MNKEEKLELAEKSSAPSDPQAKQVGDGFVAGWETDAEIDCLLGHDTSHAGLRPARWTEGGLVEAPRYSTDPRLTEEHLRKEGVEEWLPCVTVPTVKRPRKGGEPFVTEHVLVFAWQGELLATRPQPTPEAALACALWAVLNISHQ